MKRYEKPILEEEKIELVDIIAASSTETSENSSNSDPIASIFNL